MLRATRLLPRQQRLESLSRPPHRLHVDLNSLHAAARQLKLEISQRRLEHRQQPACTRALPHGPLRHLTQRALLELERDAVTVKVASELRRHRVRRVAKHAEQIVGRQVAASHSHGDAPDEFWLQSGADEVGSPSEMQHVGQGCVICRRLQLLLMLVLRRRIGTTTTTITTITTITTTITSMLLLLLLA